MVLGSVEFFEVSGLSLSPALRIVLRDMGNCVDRIELAEVISVESVREEAKLPGRLPVDISGHPRLRDICMTAVHLTGCGPIVCDDCVPTGSIRAVDEYTVEILAWRRD